MSLCIETDDFRPSLIPKWERTWDKLKAEIPELKVTCYIPIFYQEFGVNLEEDIRDNQKFKDWFLKRKDWVEIAVHGFDHKKPPEYLKNSIEQSASIKKSLAALKDYLPNYYGFKAPFYRISNITLELLRDYGFSWYCQWWCAVPLKVNIRPINIQVVGTHTGTKEQNNPDDIEIIYDKFLSDLNIYKKIGLKFSTISEEIKKSMEGFQ